MNQRYSDILKIYLKPQVLVMAFLGFSSGLPLALTGSTLLTWLAEVGMDKTAIGLFASVAIPYSLKFLWSPVIDGLRFPVLCTLLGRRRGWLLLMQVLVMAAITALAAFDPLQNLSLFVAGAFAVAFFSASQDIVVDAYRIESMEKQYFGAGAAMYSLGYRMAMLLSGAGALVLAQVLQKQYGMGFAESWQWTYLVMSAGMLVGIITTLCVKEPPLPEGTVFIDRQGKSLAQIAVLRIEHSVINPFKDFMTRGGWWMILLFVLLYRLADAFLGVMFNPFLLAIGFTKIDIAEIVKFYGMIATMVGGFIGGILVFRIGVFRTLFAVGVIHMFTNLLLVLLASKGGDREFLFLCIVAQNSTAAMGASAFVAYLSGLCKINYTATQYALLSSLSAVARTVLSTRSGKVSEWMDAHGYGWQGFFAFSSLLALPMLALLLIIHKRYGMETEKETGTDSK